MMFQAAVQPFLVLSEEEAAERGEEEAGKVLALRAELLREIKKKVREDFGTADVGVEQEGTCICRYLVDRGDLLGELQEYAVESDQAEMEAVLSGQVQTRFDHLVRIQSRQGIYLPNYFFFPFRVRARDSIYPVFVGSAPRLFEELTMVDESLEVSRSANLQRMPDFLRADREQIEDYEYAFGGDDLFWERFTFILLRRLAQLSVESRMPIFVK